MEENGRTEHTRFFINKNFIVETPFFNDGIIDGGYDWVQFDFSDCSLSNTVDYDYDVDDDVPDLLSEEEDTEEIIELD